MLSTDLKNQVLESIVKRLGLENLGDDYSKYYDAPIFSSSDDEGTGLGLDSIDVIEIIIAIKEDFNVKIKDEDMKALSNVSALAEFIENARK